MPERPEPSEEENQETKITGYGREDFKNDLLIVAGLGIVTVGKFMHESKPIHDAVEISGFTIAVWGLIRFFGRTIDKEQKPRRRY